MSGDLDLNTMIATLRTIAGPSVVREIAAEAAPFVEAAIKATASAGTSPTGEAWQEKKIGGPAMVHAASHIQAKAAGGRVRVTLTGPDAWHNYGARGVRRQVIPDGPSVPPGIAAAATKGADRVFERVMRGA